MRGAIKMLVTFFVFSFHLFFVGNKKMRICEIADWEKFFPDDSWWVWDWKTACAKKLVYLWQKLFLKNSSCCDFQKKKAKCMVSINIPSFFFCFFFKLLGNYNFYNVFWFSKKFWGHGCLNWRGMFFKNFWNLKI